MANNMSATLCGMVDDALVLLLPDGGTCARCSRFHFLFVSRNGSTRCTSCDMEAFEFERHARTQTTGA